MIECAYQRETQRIKSKQSQQIVQKLIHLMKCSQTGNFISIPQILNEIQQFTYRNQDSSQKLQAELRILTVMYEQLLGNHQICNKYMQNANEDDAYDKIRVFTFDLCAKLKAGGQITDKNLITYCKQLQKYPELCPEVLFKLTGSKTLKRMQQITFQEINQLSTDQNQKTIKFQIVSDWKYLIGQNDQAIRMKTQAMRITKMNKSCKNGSLIQQEQKQLIQLITKEAIKTIYTQKLVILKKIVRFLRTILNQDLEEQITNKNQRSRQAAKLLIPSIHKDIKLFQQAMSKNNDKSKIKDKSKNKSPKQSESSELKSSVLKKKERMQQRLELSKQFHEKSFLNNYLCIDFMPKTRLLSQCQGNFLKRMGILNKIVKKHYRDGLNRIKAIALKKQQNQKQSYQQING